MKRSSTIDEFILDLSNREVHILSSKEIENLVLCKYVFIKIMYEGNVYLLQTAYFSQTGDSDEYYSFYSAYNKGLDDFWRFTVSINTLDGSYIIGEY